MNGFTLSAFGWEGTVCPEAGGNLLRLTFRGQDMLRPRPDPCPDPFVFGAPLLFPANRTAQGRFSWEGRTYFLPVTEQASGANVHGALYRQRFTLEQLSSDRAVLCYENRGLVFPFPFRITVSYQAEEGRFRSRYRIQNTGTSAMPFTFGLHTTFPEPEWFQVPLDSRQETDRFHIPTGQILALEPEERQFCTGAPSRGRRISGFYKAGGSQTRIGSDLLFQVEGFDHWILYNGGGNAGFLCIEPQRGGVNGLNLPRCPFLEPGQTETFQTALTVLP